MNCRFMITTPIYYVNGLPHIGHAYTSIAADVIARFHRLDGKKVFFLTGTDEHGQKVEQAALMRGVTPQELVDEISSHFYRMANVLNISFDDFIRTTEPRHIVSCQTLWVALQKNDDIYKGMYEGWYALRDESFYTEDELIIADDGKKLAPTGAEVSWVSEPSYFFRLSRYKNRLLDFYQDNPNFLAPLARKNEIINFVYSGMRDLSISRTGFSWGIPVPGDELHVMYVWFDALVNYLSALGYPNMAGERFSFWPANLHLVGKEIARFHAVYWPAFLMSAGLPVPKRVFSHGWWTVEGKKMSKSIGNVVDPLVLVEEIGVDQLRYFLLRDVTFGSDGNFSYRHCLHRLNSELSNDLGNLAQRTLSLIANYCNNQVPPPSNLLPADIEILEVACDLLSNVRSSINTQALNDGLDSVWKLIRTANTYIDHQAPWKLKKVDLTRMQTVLSVLADVLRHIAIILQPYMPGSSSALLDQLGIDDGERCFSSLKDSMPVGRILPKPTGLFPRFATACSDENIM